MNTRKQSNKTQNKKKSRKKTNKRTRKNKTQKGAKSILGKCHIFDLPNNNIKLIIGRRRYYTRHFDIDPLAKEMLKKLVNDPAKKNSCIAIARQLDNEFKKLKKKI